MIFLVQTPHPWRGIYQRPHHLMARFAQAGHYVRWVETRYLRWLAGERRADFLRARAERPAPNLEVRPRTLINGERLGFIRAHNKFWLAQSLKRSLPPSASGPRILWLYNPHEVHLAGSVPHDLLVYDIMDEYQGFPWSPPNIADEERELLRRADWVFAGTAALHDSKGALAEGKIECILSGVETERFANPAPNPRVEAQIAALRARHRKLIGYAGMIDVRVDVPLLAEAAARFPDWGFVVLGPVATDVSALNNLSNVHLPGPQPYGDLPAWYRGWDAAMIPWIDHPLTQNSNPTKMLEYAAAGLPIVSRAIPEARRFYADGAWLYDSPAQFMDCLALLARADEQTLGPRLAAAREWTRQRNWDALATQMLDRVSGLLARKQSIRA